MAGKNKHDWDKVPLGTKPDAVLSEEHGIHHATIRAARNRRGIPAYKKSKLEHERFDWTGVAFGTKSDADLAQELGVKASSVGGARRRRGIPTFIEEGHKRPARAKRGIDWDDQPLGQVADRVLQRRLGLKSVSSVSRARRFRGIPKFKPPTYTALLKLHEELTEKWGDLNAVEARYIELTRLAAGQEDAKQE